MFKECARFHGEPAVSAGLLGQGEGGAGGCQHEGKMIQDTEENKAEIRSKLEGFMKTDLPYLKQIGVGPA